MLMSCIFCGSNGPFNTIEHIIPESLGNTDDLLNNGVCDKCQSYIGKEIENYVLNNSPFAFWRVIYGIKTKKGKTPFYDISQTSKGKIPDNHSFSDKGLVIYPANNLSEDIIEVEITDENLLKDILSGEKKSIKIVVTPKMLIHMGRFLGKMALEFYYKRFGKKVYNKEFDAIRNYVRYGTTNEIWPILHGNLNESLLYFQQDEIQTTETRTIYRYGLFKLTKINANMFLFDIGSDRFGIIFDMKFPPPDIVDTIIDADNNTVNFLWYPI